MSKDYQENRKRLAESLKKDPPKTPIQEVRPVETEPVSPPAKTTEKKPDEVHFNFWADRVLMQRVKIHCAKTGKSIKEVCTEALQAYLPAD
ncbi:hypothetical protein GCM10028806_56730 [Spirosoma terrae]|uniref:Uncharacterized protein n=1 Tax=Spirosoma terrae TaxID=1968276 RepID=A0A6L9L8X1_9BACT|nr:hypothetical protein [Spirosoma terrae]NDU96870.1 hypothetical protein [Spirosoma terrae]